MMLPAHQYKLLYRLMYALFVVKTTLRGQTVDVTTRSARAARALGDEAAGSLIVMDIEPQLEEQMMVTPPSYSATTAPWFVSRALWVCAAFNVVAFLFCLFVLEGVLWSLGWQYFAPLYPAPSTAYLLDFTHAQDFLQVQTLYICIPSLICALFLVGFALWRRRVTYVLGALLGLLIGDYRDYTATWHSHFGGHALHFGTHVGQLLLLGH
jgi:hypothetical protein